MDRPFVVCHMLSSLDGKIDGEFFSAPECRPALAEYGNLRGFYGCQGTLYGTTTMIGSYADGIVGELPDVSTHYGKEDYIAHSDAENYVVSIDPKGVLRWSENYIEKKGRPKAYVIEMLTETVSEVVGGKANEHFIYQRKSEPERKYGRTCKGASEKENI